MFYFLHKSISFVAVLTIDLANPISALEHRGTIGKQSRFSFTTSPSLYSARMRANECTLLLGWGEVGRGRATNMIAHNASGRRRDIPASRSVDDYVRDQPKALVKVDSSVFPRRLRGRRIWEIEYSILHPQIWLASQMSTLYSWTKTFQPDIYIIWSGHWVYFYITNINKRKRYFEFILVLQYYLERWLRQLEMNTAIVTFYWMWTTNSD